ncbi:hypothetical protein TSOC_013541 [Tetrabaena socialis]|uniref:ATP-dependent RNA helicase n=1 Tax=Tetrabaena socialis TaxID=47790 RepID=A0A2J7ZK46_9CHLO|nr:hypothetical protein TSOC_013541 [Tetrabaena socialis]|eukprot:PNH00645.1 hypothetical protein TSOC_013541 [Tetrabaena socialis]
MSKPQAVYMPLMLRPDAPDVFVKAGTGSGKTLGFLIPAIEALSRAGHVRGQGVGALVLSPTRELAVQTAQEATRLMRFHTGFRAAVVVGGANPAASDLRMLLTAPPDLLVATPGRLDDLLSRGGGKAFGHVQTVVLDEADRLLDAGFAPAVKKILRSMPGADKRRTLLLTATVPPEVRDVAKQFMHPGFVYIEASPQAAVGAAHNNIKQRAVMCGPQDIHIELARTLHNHHITNRTPKVMVFFPSTALVELYSAVFQAHPNPAWGSLYELHGGLQQNKRTRAADAFRRPGGVLFASDAAGRGMDFPSVTLVVQIGFTLSDTYQQRVGRTGRAGATGEAVILLGRDEAKGVPLLKADLEVVQAQPVLDMERQALALPPSRQKDAEAAFRGALGSYKAHARAMGWSAQGVVDAVAARLLGMGMAKVPQISEKTLSKMGLKGVSFDTEGIKARIQKTIKP